MTAFVPPPPNEYWRAVADHVGPDDFDKTISCVRWHRTDAPSRQELVSLYSWTITDPESVRFVAEHCGPRLLDPMAGSGWWCRVLAGEQVSTVAFDRHPPHLGGNSYHKAGISHAYVREGEATRVAAEYGRHHALLLSWPPCDDPIGAETLAAYTGQRVIYIGEEWGGCCGDDALFEQLEKHWSLTAEHTPIQWWGIHDRIYVYDRIGGTR